jgi:hypothetical protein
MTEGLLGGRSRHGRSQDAGGIARCDRHALELTERVKPLYDVVSLSIATRESREGLCFDEVGAIVIVPGGGFASQSD